MFKEPVQRFRVSRYLKGRGPLVVRVMTGNVRRTDGTGRSRWAGVALDSSRTSRTNGSGRSCWASRSRRAGVTCGAGCADSASRTGRTGRTRETSGSRRASITGRTGRDYVMAVKDNQPRLLAAAKAATAAARRKKGKRSAPRKELAHGRKENRMAVVASAKTVAQELDLELDFPGLRAFAMIRSKRGTDTPVERYYLLSKHFHPAQLLTIVREHWGIENRLHWTLDVVLDEDGARNRKDNAPANLAILRRLALNIARWLAHR